MTSGNTSAESSWGTLASWGDRVVATLVDIAIGIGLSLVLYAVALILGSVGDAVRAALLVLTQLASLAYAVLLGLLEGTTGQSPGKAIMGLKVVSDTNGQLIGGGQGIVRRVAHIIDGAVCFVGYLLPLFDVKRQTIADKLLTTVVLRDQEKRPFSKDIFIPPSSGGPTQIS